MIQAKPSPVSRFIGPTCSRNTDIGNAAQAWSSLGAARGPLEPLPGLRKGATQPPAQDAPSLRTPPSCGMPGGTGDFSRPNGVPLPCVRLSPYLAPLRVPQLGGPVSVSA